MADPIRADKVKEEPVEWLWRERIPRKMITIVGGRPEQGKGLFMAHLASEISKTRYVDAETGKERFGRVLYSAIEDGMAIMTKPRLMAAEANLKQVDLWRFRLPLQWDELAYHLVNGPVDLLIIDPLASHLTGGVSRHSDNIRKVTDPLAELIEVTGTACVVVEHVLKRVPQSGYALAAIGGTGSGLVAAARMAFLFGIDPGDDDHRILAAVKNNIRDKPKEISFEVDTETIRGIGEIPHLVYDGETVFDPTRFLSVTRHHGQLGRSAPKRANASEWLAKYLYVKGKPVKAGTIFEDALQFGYTKKMIRAVGKEMEIVHTPPGGGRNSHWSLPDELRDLLKTVSDEVDEENVQAAAATNGSTPAPPEGAPDGDVDGADIDDELQKLVEGGDSK